MQTLRDIISKGNSSSRQRAIFEATGDLTAVTRHQITECVTGTPIWDTRPSLSRSA